MKSNELIQRAFSNVFKREIDFDYDVPREDISDWDSFAHIELIIEIEKLAEVRFSLADLEAIDSLASLMCSLERIIHS